MPTIMTVDDSNSMRQMVSFTLQSVGYEVLEAMNGEQALGMAKTRKFDLVIADLNMPQMDGFALIKSLRGLKDYKFTPILVLTTESQDTKRKEGRAAGATGWLVKPFNPEQLISVVQKVLA